MTFKPIFGQFPILSLILVIFRVSRFHVSHLTHETFNLYLQNTLNMSKTARVYFGVLHIQTKHQDLLGFVINSTSISLHLTMNPTTREDSILILFLVGLTNLNFKKSKFQIQFYQNPRFRDKILTIQSLKIPCDPYKIHT